MTDTHEGSHVCRHFQAAADLLGQRWVPQILGALLDGVTRYSELKTAVQGISHASLSDRLKELESRSIVVRVVTPSTPVRVDYRLTPAGEDLARVIGELGAWAERWAKEPAASPA
jgi:DNA-binding HxlR family transcriptional regulator